MYCVYRLKLDSYVYYGQTGVSLRMRAEQHMYSADRHPGSYIHQQIKLRALKIDDILKLMIPLCLVDSKDQSLLIEKHLIYKATERGELVCNTPIKSFKKYKEKRVLTKKYRSKKWFRDVQELIKQFTFETTKSKHKGLISDEDWAMIMKMCHELDYKLEIEKGKVV